MIIKTIASHTTNEELYPAFINIAQINENQVRISVRSHPRVHKQADGKIIAAVCGETSYIDIQIETFNKLIADSSSE